MLDHSFNEQLESGMHMHAEETRIASTKEEVSTQLLEVLPDLRAFARSLTKERVLADDLVQDAAVRTLTSAHLFARGTNFKAWAFTIVRNCFYNHGRLNGRYTALPDDRGDAGALGDQEQSLEMCEFRRAFWQLSLDHREILTLIGPAGMSYEDAAAVCGCAVGTVKSRVSRARSELRQILDAGDFTISRLDTGAIAATQIDDWFNAFASLDIKSLHADRS